MHYNILKSTLIKPESLKNKEKNSSFEFHCHACYIVYISGTLLAWQASMHEGCALSASISSWRFLSNACRLSIKMEHIKTLDSISRNLGGLCMKTQSVFTK